MLNGFANKQVSGAVNYPCIHLCMYFLNILILFTGKLVRKKDKMSKEDWKYWKEDELNVLDEEEPYDDDETSDFEDEIVFLSEHETDSSSEGESDEDVEVDGGKNLIYGKKGYKWSLKEPPKSRTALRNIITNIPGPKGAAKNISSEEEAWRILFNNDIVEKIVLHTNEEIERQQRNYSQDTRYVGKTDFIEISAFIGLLYIAGARKDAHLAICKMFSAEGPRIYRAIIGESRLKFLINCLRFDDKTVRDRSDKFAPIREIWSIFINNCTKSYTPHSYCTIDEQLLGFRGKCPFRVYISSKPDKYGIKVVCMCDSRTYYMVSGIPYIGKENRNNDEPLASFLVKSLSASIHGTHRNITMDN